MLVSRDAEEIAVQEWRDEAYDAVEEAPLTRRGDGPACR